MGVMNGYRFGAWLYLIVFFIMGTVLCGYGVYNLKAQMDLDKHGLKTKGKVIELMHNSEYRRAIVEFTDSKKEKITFVDKLDWNPSTVGEKYKIGQVVDVLYDPGEPQRTAMINDFFQRNTAPWWPFLLGVIAFLVGFFMRLYMRKKAKEFDIKMAEMEAAYRK